MALDSVTPGTVEETGPAGLIDTPALQHVSQRPPGCDRVPGGQKLIMSGIVRYLARSYGWLGCRDRCWPAFSRQAWRRFLTTCAG